MRDRSPTPIVVVGADLKDGDVRTGQFVTLMTDEILDRYGNETNHTYQVVKRERKENSIVFTLLRCASTSSGANRKSAHAAPDSVPEYTQASEAERAFYGFAADAQGKMSNGDEGYYAY